MKNASLSKLSLKERVLKKTGRWAATGALVATFLVPMGWHGVALAEDLQIVEVPVPKLRLWKTPAAKEVLVDIDPEEVPENLPVNSVTSNRMLEVTIDGHTGYVLSYHVVTNQKVEAQVYCDAVIGATSLAGSRGIGEGCE